MGSSNCHSDNVSDLLESASAAYLQHARLLSRAAPAADRTSPSARVPTGRAHAPSNIKSAVVRNDVRNVTRAVRVAQLARRKSQQGQEVVRDALEHVFQVGRGAGRQVRALVDLDEPGLERAVDDKVKTVEREKGRCAVGVSGCCGAQLGQHVQQELYHTGLYLVQDGVKV